MTQDYAAALVCHQARSLMQEALDGPLSPAERRGLEAHLVGCESCRSYGRELSKLRAALWEVPAAPLPRQALEQVWDKTIRRGGAPGWHRQLITWKPIAAAAVIVLVVLWHQLSAPVAPPAASPAELERLAADTRLVLQIACEAVSLAQRITAQDVLQDRVNATLKGIPIPVPGLHPTPNKEIRRGLDP